MRPMTCCGAPDDGPHDVGCRYSGPATRPTGGPFTIGRKVSGPTGPGWIVIERNGMLGTARQLLSDRVPFATEDEATNYARAMMGDPAGKRAFYSLTVQHRGPRGLVDQDGITLRGEA